MSWFKRDKPQADVPAKLAAPKDPVTPPGQRLHHEYFADAEPVNGRYHWKGRVYAADATVYEDSGDEPSHREACMSAIRWAEAKKNELRRIP